MVQSLDRGIKILELIVERKLVGVMEVASYFGINKSNAFRLLDTLRLNSLVEKDKITDKYKICAGILKLSNAFLDNSAGKIIHPYLEKLVALTRENAHYCVFSNDRVIVIDQIKSTEVINITAQIGREEKMHCTSVGKVILSYLPEETRDRIIESIDLKPMTKHTIISKKILREQVNKIRNDGYAIDDEENVIGVRCIAAPIRNHRGEVNYCIGISAPSMRMELSMFPEFIKIVKDVAAEISTQFGYVENNYDKMNNTGEESSGNWPGLTA